MIWVYKFVVVMVIMLIYWMIVSDPIFIFVFNFCTSLLISIYSKRIFECCPFEWIEIFKWFLIFKFHQARDTYIKITRSWFITLDSGVVFDNAIDKALTLHVYAFDSQWFDPFLHFGGLGMARPLIMPVVNGMSIKKFSMEVTFHLSGKLPSFTISASHTDLIIVTLWFTIRVDASAVGWVSW